MAKIIENKNYISLLLANTILGSAMPMLIILGGLAGLKLAPSTALATLPASLQTLAGMLAAAPFSMLMGKFGRKIGFVVGVGCAIIGGLAGMWALMTANFLLLCFAHLALGAALACYQYFRFAAAETVTPSWQPVAISLMLTSGLIAAFVGPQIFIIAKDYFLPVPFAGAYFSIAILSLLGLIPLAFTTLPLAPKVKSPQTVRNKFASLKILKRREIRLAVGLGAISHGVMIFLMVPTPLAMIGCGFSEAVAGDVIRWHVVAMFAPSFVTGFLIKRLGVHKIASFGLALLIASALLALSGLDKVYFYLSLILLGIGWNFGFIGATTMLASAVSEEEKALVQGVNDTVIALVATIFAFSAGAIIAGFSWTMLAMITLAILIIAMCAFWVEVKNSDC